MVRQDGFGDLVADAHDRIEGGHGLLKNHGDLRAAEEAHGFIGDCGEVELGGVCCAGELNLARDAGLRRKQAHDGEGSDRLT